MHVLERKTVSGMSPRDRPDHCCCRVERVQAPRGRDTPVDHRSRAGGGGGKAH